MADAWHNPAYRPHEFVDPSRHLADGAPSALDSHTQKSKKSSLGDDDAPTQPEHRQLAPCSQLIGEGPGHPKQLGHLGHREDETIVEMLTGWWRRSLGHSIALLKVRSSHT